MVIKVEITNNHFVFDPLIVSRYGSVQCGKITI